MHFVETPRNSQLENHNLQSDFIFPTGIKHTTYSQQMTSLGIIAETDRCEQRAPSRAFRCFVNCQICLRHPFFILHGNNQKKKNNIAV